MTLRYGCIRAESHYGGSSGNVWLTGRFYGDSINGTDIGRVLSTHREETSIPTPFVAHVSPDEGDFVALAPVRRRLQHLRRRPRAPNADPGGVDGRH